MGLETILIGSAIASTATSLYTANKARQQRKDAMKIAESRKEPPPPPEPGQAARKVDAGIYDLQRRQGRRSTLAYGDEEKPTVDLFG
jgi:hypothetical protein